ncbi:MAG: GH3 auxin-responsive promoter family protein, partial [Myxococcales bacterium]|nr:GH3 auxin-responsive promoter family protein [Myxococcales bacterium]
ATGSAPWLDRVSRGDAGVFMAEPPAMFFRTAGTTGAPKALPATTTAMATSRGPAMYALWGNFLAFHPELLDSDHATIDLHWDRRPTSETLGGIAVQSMAQRHGVLHPDDFTPPWYDAPWFRPQPEIADFADRLYDKIRFFAAHDVRAVASINPVTLHLFAETLARNTDRLIEELRTGASADVPLADRLRAAANARDGRLLPVDVWPHITFVGCRKSATAALYLPRLPQLFGAHVDVLPYSTAGAECSQAIPVDRHATAGIAALRSAFLEYLPAAEAWRADSPTCLVHELELGAEYQTVLTTPDGLYRYAIGDTFQVVGFLGRAPQLEYRGRVGRVSSMVGEQLTEPQIVDAGLLVARRFGLDLAMFACCPRPLPRPHYVFAMETSERSGAIHAVATALDAALMAANPTYRAARGAGELAEATVEHVEPGAFHDHWLGSVRRGRGTIQLQIQPLQKDDAIVRLLAEDRPVCAE